MGRSQAPAHIESLIREYLHGSRLLPLAPSSRLQPHGQAPAERIAAERRAPAAGEQPALQRLASDS